MSQNSHSQKATIPSYQDIAQATFGTLWPEATPQDWALVVHKLREALQAKSNGPLDRDAVLEEAAKVADVEWLSTNSLARSKCAGDIARAIRALKNAAPQGGTSSGVEHPSNGGVGGSSPQPVPAEASSKAGADDAHGHLIEMGDLETVDSDGSKHKQPMSLLIRFDSVEAIRKAIEDERCAFSWPSSNATDRSS